MSQTPRDIIASLPKEFITGLNQDLVEATQEAMRQKFNTVSGTTIESVRAEDKIDGNVLMLTSFGSGGTKYLIAGKKANTKLPVKRSGDKFELVDHLKSWAKAVNFRGSDFVLANSIAKKARKGIPIASTVIRNFKRLSFDKLITRITSLQGKEIVKQSKRRKK